VLAFGNKVDRTLHSFEGPLNQTGRGANRGRLTMSDSSMRRWA
jgi:hypothetical protein